MSTCKTLVKLVPLDGKTSALRDFVLRVVKKIRKVDGLLLLEVDENEENGDLYLYYVWESREKELAYVQSEVYEQTISEMNSAHCMKGEEKMLVQLTTIDR